MTTLKPVIVDGNLIKGYFVCSNGNIWSTMGVDLRMMSSVGKPYPKVHLSLGNGKSKTYPTHRLVCEAFHEFPTPEGVSQSEWDVTPNSVKKILNSMYHVNHIDHDHWNHHPSNLEWVTFKQNAKRYQEHRLAAK